MRREIRARCEKQNTVRRQVLIKDSAENEIDRSSSARVSHVAPEPKFITFALSVIRSTATADKPKPLEQISAGESRRFPFRQRRRSVNIHSRNHSSVATGHPPQRQTNGKNPLQTVTHGVGPDINRSPYRCAVDREHLSERGRKAFCCEMSGGGGVVSDLVGWLNTEGLRPKW